jgi:outer membrane protein
VKYVTIDTDIFVKASGAKVTKLDIDPLLIGVGIGYRF